MSPSPLISTGNLKPGSLTNQIVLLTGGGNGIGVEAARSLAWLGAQVIIAEINLEAGQRTEAHLRQEFGPQSAWFIPTDIGDEQQVASLKQQVLARYGKVDVVFNNATLAPFGMVTETPLADWDRSYRVNLRGPVLLAQAFIPAMVARNQGAFICVSSVGGIYMGAYEILKSAQVELARTLCAELEGTDVIVFTIGPGIVPTQTAQNGIAQIASRYGKTPEEFFADYKDHQLSVEAAGASFAAAVALAPQFRGMEIGGISALNVAGIKLGEAVVSPSVQEGISATQLEQAQQMCQTVLATLKREHAGWLKRPLFERMWMMRDFKQNAGRSVEDCEKALESLAAQLHQQDFSHLADHHQTVSQLAKYYDHYLALAKTGAKSAEQLTEWTQAIQSWQAEVTQLLNLLN